jgi:hypothetical protein
MSVCIKTRLRKGCRFGEESDKGAIENSRVGEPSGILEDKIAQ